MLKIVVKYLIELFSKHNKIPGFVDKDLKAFKVSVTEAPNIASL